MEHVRRITAPSTPILLQRMLDAPLLDHAQIPETAMKPEDRKTIEEALENVRKAVNDHRPPECAPDFYVGRQLDRALAELNAFANDCRRMNLEWVAPLDRSRMEYTATECSEIARKRYADEPRKTSQQKEYAQGLEDGYGHALFEHAAKADRSRMVEAGDKMCALLCLFYKESATTLPEALRKDLVELVNAWESAKK